MTDSVVSTRVVAVAASIFLAATFTVWAESWAADRVTKTVAELQAPEQVAGWTKVSEPTLWTAETLPTEHTIAARYRSGSDEVQLFVAFFPQQRQGVEAISNENELAEEIFRYARMGTVVATMGSEQVPVNQARAMVRVNGVLHEHLVWQWYRVAGHSLVNRYAGKVREAVARLYPGRADGAWIAVTTPYDEQHLQASRQRLENFVKEMAPLLEIAIDSVLGYEE
jgi:EpsI family protein